MVIWLIHNVTLYCNSLHPDGISGDLPMPTIVQGKVIDYNLHYVELSVDHDIHKQGISLKMACICAHTGQ